MSFLPDFVNTTGDAVFDGTLKQALAVQLEQSPFLNVYPDERVREALKYAGHSPDDRVTVPIARDLCQREAVKAILGGSISSLGSNYVVTLEALNCRTGDTIARQQVEAGNPEKVLAALGTAAKALRGPLGEGVNTIERFSAPIEQATTSSLEAMKAYALGDEKRLKMAISPVFLSTNEQPSWTRISPWPTLGWALSMETAGKYAWRRKAHKRPSICANGQASEKSFTSRLTTTVT